MVLAQTGLWRLPPAVVDGTGASALDLLCQQLWSTPVTEGHVRLVVNPADSDRSQWQTVQTYWVVPSRRSPQILIPAESRPLTRRALTSYQGLRALRPRAARIVMGAAARMGIPPSPDRLVVQVPGQRPGTAPLDQVSLLSEVLAVPGLRAAIGIRRGANAKASLHLFSPEGVPEGLAKVSWNTLTRNFVENEAGVLEALAGDAGLLRTPRLLTTGRVGGNSYFVAAPLPPDVRQVIDPRALTFSEITTMFPVIRRDHALHSAQLQAAASSLRREGPASAPTEIRQAFEQLWSLLEETRAKVAIAARWHGDLVPWNLGRDANGQAWLWDWESSETDVVAGLDIIHWLLHSQPGWQRQTVDLRLRGAVPLADQPLRALGQGRVQQRIAGAAYAVTIAARTVGLASEHGDWSRVLLQPREIVDLLHEGSRLLAMCSSGHEADGSESAPDVRSR